MPFTKTKIVNTDTWLVCGQYAATQSIEEMHKTLHRDGVCSTPIAKYGTDI